MMATFRDRLYESSRSLTPDASPLPWMIINAICGCFSLLLLAIVFACEDDSRLVEVANKSYLVYDFGTTGIWIVETILNALSQTNDSKLALRIELALAIVFFVQSGQVLYDWRWRDEDIEVIGPNVGLSFVGYVFVFIVTYQKYKKRRTYESLTGDGPIPSIVI